MERSRIGTCKSTVAGNEPVRVFLPRLLAMDLGGARTGRRDEGSSLCNRLIRGMHGAGFSQRAGTRQGTRRISPFPEPGRRHVLFACPLPWRHAWRHSSGFLHGDLPVPPRACPVRDHRPLRQRQPAHFTRSRRDRSARYSQACRGHRPSFPTAVSAMEIRTDERTAILAGADERPANSRG